MKVTHRTLHKAAQDANAGVMKDYPFGLRVYPAGTVYCLSLLWRHTPSKSTPLMTGSPREVLASINAIVAFAAAAKEPLF